MDTFTTGAAFRLDEAVLLQLDLRRSTKLIRIPLDRRRSLLALERLPSPLLSVVLSFCAAKLFGWLSSVRSLIADGLSNFLKAEAELLSLDLVEFLAILKHTVAGWKVRMRHKTLVKFQRHKNLWIWITRRSDDLILRRSEECNGTSWIKIINRYYSKVFSAARCY